MRKQKLDDQFNEISALLKKRIRDSERITIVMAPPGSGKTHLLVDVLAAAVQDKKRIAVATPTNAQADEVCERLAKSYPTVSVIRYVGSTAPTVLGSKYVRTSDKNAVTALSSGVVVGSVAKWGFVDFRNDQSFDYLVIEESWQVKLADFLALLPLSERFVLIGDPGQIDPVVTVDPSRWSTSATGPHRAAPDAILDSSISGLATLKLPATRRLPADSAKIVSAFYDFEFESYADLGERKLEFTAKSNGPSLKNIWESCEGSTTVGLVIDPRKLPGPPPLEGDRAIAQLTAKIVSALVDMKPMAHVGDKVPLKLLPEHIGIASTRRVIVQDIIQSLPSNLRDRIRVDTPERWQGLQRPVMFSVHPLSSVVKPSAFDLETGRLCVMASRHMSQLFVVSRGHIDEMLDQYDPPGDQALGGDDVTGKGHSSHEEFISALKKKGMWLKVS